MTTPSLTWDDARLLYPGVREVAYLDTAAMGLLSTRVRDAMTAMVTGHHLLGAASSPDWYAEVAATRAAIANLVGGQADGVAFTQNTSTGLAIVANGLDWGVGDNIVVPAGEFPSNFYPWLQLRRRGVEVREVTMVGGAAPIAELVGAVDRHTRVVALSAVQYSSGHRYDLAAVGQACAESDALVVVDGTQAVGAMVVDTGALGIDVLAVSSHKWVLGPLGIGFVHLSARAMDRLTPSTVGWLSVEEPFAFDHEPRLAPDARRFESGTENAVGMAGLGTTVALMHELGPQRIEARVLDLADELGALMPSVGLTRVASPDRAQRSGIVIARSADGDDRSLTVLHQRLLAGGVRCSLRATGLRFAPHYFVDASDLARVVDVLR